MFSKACEYSIRAAIYIASRSMEGKRANLKEIALAIDSPEAFTAKLLQQLVKSDIIESVKGAQGGFEIPRKQLSKTSLCDVVKAVDGDGLFTRCGIGLSACSEKNPCPIHHKFKTVRKNLIKMLDNTDLAELGKGFDGGKTALRI
jgi:Rrf2 family transcriptional regulator, iron-sulfur cluster assembly transcription factor